MLGAISLSWGGGYLLRLCWGHSLEGMGTGWTERKGGGEEGENVQQQRSCFHANVVVSPKGKREGLPGRAGTPEPPGCKPQSCCSCSVKVWKAPVTCCRANSAQSASSSLKYSHPPTRTWAPGGPKQTVPSSQSGCRVSYCRILPLLTDHWRCRSF